MSQDRAKAQLLWRELYDDNHDRASLSRPKCCQDYKYPTTRRKLPTTVRGLPEHRRDLSDNGTYRFASRFSASRFLVIDALTLLGVFLPDVCSDEPPFSLRTANLPVLAIRVIVALVFFVIETPSSLSQNAYFG